MKKWCSVLCLSVAGLWANPQTPTVVAGTATFSNPNPSTLRINASHNAIIDWQSFSIGAGEITKFVQPAAHSAVLNRVAGMNPSSLQGALQANGKVLLINQNGILISATGLINTSSFLASTLDVPNSEFLAGGDMHFFGTSTAEVHNEGSVNGWNENIILIGRHVSHQGEMNAPLGAVCAGAGEHIVVKAAGADHILIQPSMSLPSGDGIYSSGLISAIASELKADGNLYALAINVTGMVEALGVDAQDSRIVLSAEGGSTRLNSLLRAMNDNGIGGEIQVLGETVQLESGAIADASGFAGGGLILIGGNVPETGPAVYNSTQTIVGNGAVLNASAQGSGNGGTATVWSDGETSFHGFASAEGGSVGGGGGRVNVGGRETLYITGNGSTLAPFGSVGLMAMGASNIDVRAGQLPMPPANTIDTSFLVDNLSRNSVAIVTLEDWPGTREILVHDPIVWTSPHGLIFEAGRDIQFRANILSLDMTGKAFLYAKTKQDLIAYPNGGPLSIFVPQSFIEWYADRDLIVEGGSWYNSSVTVSADAITFQSGRDMKFFGGAVDGSFVEIDGTSSCLLDTGGLSPGGYLHTQGGSGAATDVHVRKATVTSSGFN